jgi:hypothetical protein
MILDPAALERFPEDLEFLANAANARNTLTRLGATLGFKTGALTTAQHVFRSFPPTHQRELLASLAAVLFRCEAAAYARSTRAVH